MTEGKRNQNVVEWKLQSDIDYTRNAIINRARSLAERLTRLQALQSIRVLAREVPFAPANELRDMADTLRSKLGSGVVVIGARGDGNVSLVAAVSKALTGRVRAGDLVKRLSPIVGGGGGGRPDFAQAGGKDASKLPEAMKKAEEIGAPVTDEGFKAFVQKVADGK